MLELHVRGSEIYDEANNRFITLEQRTLTLEHSLYSISKWEQKWHKPFLSPTAKNRDEELDYIKCMILDDDVDDAVVHSLSVSDFEAIRAYIEDPATATTIHKNQKRPSREVITSEVIYYWMVELGIPFECDRWNLNRLLMLITVCNVKHTPSKKMRRNDQLAQQRSLNAARRARSGSRG